MYCSCVRNGRNIKMMIFKHLQTGFSLYESNVRQGVQAVTSSHASSSAADWLRSTSAPQTTGKEQRSLIHILQFQSLYLFPYLFCETIIPQKEKMIFECQRPSTDTDRHRPNMTDMEALIAPTLTPKWMSIPLQL